jgi:hypothetical protein
MIRRKEGGSMTHPELPKCLSCKKLFRADPRNARHQKYCCEPNCRKASKAASRCAWLAKPENQDYFRGPENVVRVQAWRAAHAQYWRRPAGQKAQKPIALQDVCRAQPIEITSDSKSLSPPASKDTLQDLLARQPAVLVGFIAQFTGSALQDDIVRSTRRLVELGQDILAGRDGGGHQTGDLFRTSA